MEVGTVRMNKSLGARLRWMLYAVGLVFAAAFILSYATGR
jgi:hypothetical protein